MMRVPIRVQLGSLLLLSSLIGLAVLSVAVWITVHSFVLNLRGIRLANTASLKAAQLVSNLSLLQTSASFVGTRVLIQAALGRYRHSNNNTQSNWDSAYADLAAAVGGNNSPGQALLLQCKIFPATGNGSAGSNSVLNATAWGSNGNVQLPYTYQNGTHLVLGANDSEAGNLGFPPWLYPNLTYTSVPGSDAAVVSYGNDTLTEDSVLVLGPWMSNETYSIISLTVPIINITDRTDTLGWLTALMNAALLGQVIHSRDGLGKTGETLLVGPTTSDNLFAESQLDGSLSEQAQAEIPVRYVIPLNASDSARHPNQTIGSSTPPFEAGQYPAVLKTLAAARDDTYDSSGSSVRAFNEAGKKVSVGFAKVLTNMVDWIIIIEYSRGEVWQPINHIRDVILACLFATAGFMIIVSYPLAHFASLPILRLREATRRSIEPPSGASVSSMASFDSLRESPVDSGRGEKSIVTGKQGTKFSISHWRRKRAADLQVRMDERRKRAFRIPGKVKERKHWIKDELSELTMTFNEMSDELMMQYSKLEERVQQRTAELELSKKAAEAANESKTLFIANISHELKTPLNGILGMCAVCMQEDDPIRLKRSLGIIYKSGDLLLNLLTDLLTFSKNQVGQHLTLDEKEFRLGDISSQTMAIFDKQAKDGEVDLRVVFEGAQVIDSDHFALANMDHGPSVSGKIHNMILWGDIHRILQVVINLVSNALKFTPAGGSVVLTVRCLGDAPEIGTSRKSSLNSKQSRRHSSRRGNSDVTLSFAKGDGPNSANARDRPIPLAYAIERAASPPPGRFLYFEFEVTDTGPGIAENLQHKIFEPFVQGDLGLTKKYGGTGLGLSICSQLASLMRGSISLRSTVGVGSTFTLKIPIRHLQTRTDSSASSMDLRAEDTNIPSLRDGDVNRKTGPHNSDPEKDAVAVGVEMPKPDHSKTTSGVGVTESKPRLVGLSQPFFTSSQPMESPGSQPGAMQKITAEATRGGRIRVLVAEDNKVNQEVVLRMLKLEDIYDVTVAKDGQEALDLVKESMAGDDRKQFNLIFMDVQMPNVDGLTSTRLIREIGYQAPIVALTAFAEDSNIKDCLDSGMNYFLSKPIRRPQLKKVLKEYCTPIMEEEYEDTTPPDAPRRLSTTTIVMVNSGPNAVDGANISPISPVSPTSGIPDRQLDTLIPPATSIFASSQPQTAVTAPTLNSPAPPPVIVVDDQRPVSPLSTT